MKKIICLVFLVGLAYSYTLSIGYCSRYGFNGDQCLECVSGYDLFEGDCYPKIQGCKEYKAENLCSKCSVNLILVSNQCCDGDCFNKLLKNTNQETQKYALQKNLAHVLKVIDISQNQLLDKNDAQLVKIDFKIFREVERWFLLFQISNNSYQRIVLDYNRNSNNQNYLVIDFSQIKNPQNFNLVQWTEVETDLSILLMFQKLYPSLEQYIDVICKEAVLSQVRQFQITTITSDKIVFRTLYEIVQQTILLKQNVVSLAAQGASSITSKPFIVDDSSKRSAPANTSETKVINDGCSTHTLFEPPFSAQIKALADKLSTLKSENLMKKVNPKNSSAPFIRTPGLILRRLVTTQICASSTFRQVAYVQGDGTSTKEYFTYYLEVDDADNGKQWHYLGNKNKTQTPTIFANPRLYPVQMVDPSFVVYPNTTLYNQRGTIDMFRRHLSTQDEAVAVSLQVAATTEKNRKMGKIQRFAIDGIDPASLERYRLAGWEFVEQPNGFDIEVEMISLMCEESLEVESVVIGSSSPKLNARKTERNSTELINIRD